MTASATLPAGCTMEAGPEMDLRIAHDVMHQCAVSKAEDIGREVAPPYSTDDPTALEVLKKIPRLLFALGPGYSGTGLYWHEGRWFFGDPTPSRPTFRYADGCSSLALAICRAALHSALR